MLSSLVFVRPVTASPFAYAVIQNDTSYIDISRSYHVVGEVKNIGDTWLRYIIISASLKDENGTVVDIKPATPLLFHLPPNATVGFDAVELNKTLSATIRSYTLTLTYRISQPKSMLLRVSDLNSSKNVLGWLQVHGQIANTGNSASENTVVTGTFYDANGKVVYVTLTSLAKSTIAAGTSQSFTLSVVDPTRSKLVSTYSVAAESLQYVSIET